MRELTAERRRRVELAHAGTAGEGPGP
jgi:hypothetical protein